MGTLFLARLVVTGQGVLLREDRFRLDIRKKFFTMRVLKHWMGCPERQWMPHPWKHSKSSWMEL